MIDFFKKIIRLFCKDTSCVYIHRDASSKTGQIYDVYIEKVSALKEFVDKSIACGSTIDTDEFHAFVSSNIDCWLYSYKNGKPKDMLYRKKVSE